MPDLVRVESAERRSSRSRTTMHRAEDQGWYLRMMSDQGGEHLFATRDWCSVWPLRCARATCTHARSSPLSHCAQFVARICTLR